MCVLERADTAGGQFAKPFHNSSTVVLFEFFPYFATSLKDVNAFPSVDVNWARIMGKGFPGSSVVENPEYRGHRFDPWSGKIAHASE